MFLVFEEVQRGVYKRALVSVTTAAGEKGGENPELHMDDPLEIKGTAQGNNGHGAIRAKETDYLIFFTRLTFVKHFSWFQKH